MQADNKGKKYLTEKEISKIISSVRNPGLRFTVDLYLLDYIKHCFLEDGQLDSNIQKLQAALDHLDDGKIKKGVEDVLKCLQCVKEEYGEYLEDTKILSKGDYPPPRGAGQSSNDLVKKPE